MPSEACFRHDTSEPSAKTHLPARPFAGILTRDHLRLSALVTDGEIFSQERIRTSKKIGLRMTLAFATKTIVYMKYPEVKT